MVVMLWFFVSISRTSIAPYKRIAHGSFLFKFCMHAIKLLFFLLHVVGSTVLSREYNTFV